MGQLKARGRKKKAELEARKAAAHTRQAAEDTGTAVRELALALVEQLKSIRVDELAGELAERVRDSEAGARAAAKREELAKRTRKAYQDAGLDDRAADAAARLRKSEAYQSTRAGASKATASTLAGLGAWLASGDRGERLGVQQRKRSRGWLPALFGILAGYAVGVLTAPKPGRETVQDLSRRGSSLAGDLKAARSSSSSSDSSDDLVTSGSSFEPDYTVGSPVSEKPLEDQIRTRLGEDPRTADLPRLNINVAEGTVFVRGVIPQDADEESIRAVIVSIPGVEDIDLQLTETTA